MTDFNALITDNIDIWSCAVEKKASTGRGSSKKINLVGIQNLRSLILDLAMRGKLVPQNKNDESAQILIENITSEKADLYSQKLIKKPKKFTPIPEEEKPYTLPGGWCWEKLGTICKKVTDGSHNPPKNAGHGYPMLSSQNVNFGTIDFDNPSRFVTQEGYDKEDSRTCIKPNDVLLNIVASIGRSAVVPSNAPKFVLQRSVAVLASQIDSNFFAKMLVSPLCLSYYDEHAKGTAQKGIYLGKLSEMPLVIPPIKEQKRIINKVNKLMALCDQLEQQTEASIDAHQLLVKELLSTLTNSSNAQEFEQNWTRIAEHFDLLFTTEHSIEQLKQTILQLAIMGKLVPQDPNDEPASKLLERIAQEKEQLIEDKVIKKQKPLPELSEEEKAFKMPKGWGICRLNDICYGITSGSTPPKPYWREDAGIPYLKVYNIRNQEIDFAYKPQFVDKEHHNSKLTRSILHPNDVVMNIVGPPLGKIAIIPNTYAEWNCNQAIVFFRPIDARFSTYIYRYLTAGTFLDSIELIGTAGQDNISVTKSRMIILPTPPIEEQARIVAKVDELLLTCEALQAHISNASNTKVQLSETIVQSALR